MNQTRYISSLYPKQITASVSIKHITASAAEEFSREMGNVIDVSKVSRLKHDCI